MLMRKLKNNTVDSSHLLISIIFFFLDHLGSSVPKCYKCESKNAEYWCESDCKHSFCGSCWNMIHETGQYRNHTKILVKDKPLEMPKCQEHTEEDEKGKYWCEGCSKEICGSCQQLKHKDHKLIIITEFVKDVQVQVSIKMKFFYVSVLKSFTTVYCRLLA